MGLIRDRRAIAVARRLEAFCERADRIVAVTEGIREGLVEHGVPRSKVVLITNGVDLDLGNGARPASAPVPDGAFVAMYLGAHGTYSALETLLDAAAELRDAPEVRLVLVGNGDRKPALVESRPGARAGQRRLRRPRAQARGALLARAGRRVRPALSGQPSSRARFPTRPSTTWAPGARSSRPPRRAS